METRWPAEPELFTIQFFTEKVAHLCTLSTKRLEDLVGLSAN